MSVPNRLRSYAAPPRHLEYVEGWGMATGFESTVFQPRSVEEVQAALCHARESGQSLALRGTGCSYGDASVTRDGLVLDLTHMRRILGFDEQQGVCNLEAGATIGDLWHKSLPHGFWPKVVSGTMFPTMGGACGMNIHGKNNYAVGTFGDNTLELDLVLPSGELVVCNREENSDLFHAAIGGFGMLGVITRVKLRTKAIHSGDLWVRGIATNTLREMMNVIEERKQDADYLVGWIDAFGRGENLGRGLIHEGRYFEPGEDEDPAATLQLAHQELPERIMGLFPKSQVWRFLRLLNNDVGMRALNLAKVQAGRIEGMKGWYKQSHAAFNFLLDFVPDWKWAYGRKKGFGLIQYQSFVPKENASEVFEELLRLGQKRGFTSYLAVMKRHRPDPFWMTHALDGWSLAFDFKVRPEKREALFDFCREMSEVVLAGGGKYYFAKDFCLQAGDAERFLPSDKLDAFCALKRKVDPEGLLQTDLARRLFGERLLQTSS